MSTSDLIFNIFTILFDLMQTAILVLCIYIIKDNKKNRKKGCIKNEIIKLLLKRQLATKTQKARIDVKISELENKLRELEDAI